MKRARRGKGFFEFCVLVGCSLLIFVSVVQFVSFAQRARSRAYNKSGIAANMLSYAPTSPNNGIRDSNSNKLNHMSRMQIVSGIQAKLRARTRVQQEVRELERALAKLIRENSVTPDESFSMFRNELYARRVGLIIQQARENGVVPLKNKASSQGLSKASLESTVNNTSDASAVSSRDSGGLFDRYSSYNVFNEEGEYPSYQDRGVGSVNQSNVPLNYASERTFSSEVEYFHEKHDIIRKRKSRSQLGVDVINTSDDSEEKIFGENINVSKVDLTDVVGKDGSLHRNEVGKGTSISSSFEACPLVPRFLVGQVKDIDLKSEININDIVRQHYDILEGGEWKPASCLARHRVAIIIPYRDRWSHLKTLLNYLLPILKKQQIHFRVFIVEQFGEDTFNKGRIMNAAFREAVKLFDFDCVTFHDVDLVPEDDRNMYTCADQPKHMSIAIDKFSYILPYQGLVGGVLTFLREHFQMVNGYSNMYWGWGAEDDDMTTRILHKGFRIYRPPTNIARYKMVKHGQRKISEATVRMKLLRSAARRSKLEGLNNVMYKVLFTHKEKLFTHFMVDIGKP